MPPNRPRPRYRSFGAAGRPLPLDAMGEEFGVGDATDREEKALSQLTDRLVDHFGHSHSPELVQELVGQVRQRFDGHAVRDFVPILVERIVRRELQHLPPQPSRDDYPEFSEFAAAQAVTIHSTDPAADSGPDDTPSVPATDVSGPDGPDGTNGEAEAATAPLPETAESAPVDSAAGAVLAASGAADTEATRPVVVAATTTSADAEATTPNVVETDHDSGDSTENRSGDERTRTEPPSGAPPRPAATAEPVGAQQVSPVGTGPEPATPAPAGFVATLRRPRVAAGLAAAVVVVVALAVAFAFRDDGDAPAAGPAPALLTVHGVVGSEKMEFFTDPRVADVLARKGFRLEVEPAGSRQIATSVDLSRDDFAFPSSSLAAERVQRERGITAKYTPFSSPMVVASFRPVTELLTRSGIVRPGPVPTFDMHRYLDLTQQGTQWDQLPGNTSYPVRKNVLISTTDPRTSNSAAMYLAVAAYVANDDAVVQGPTAENFVLSKVSRLFTRQGYTENSSAGPFAEYLSAGMGPTPMVWGYESQYVEAAVAGRLPADAELLYPSPTVLSRHTLVPLTPTGDRIGRLLSTDPELQRLAAEHGFRTADPAQFAAVTAEHHIPVAKEVFDVVDTPTYDTLEHLLDGVARSYN